MNTDHAIGLPPVNPAGTVTPVPPATALGPGRTDHVGNTDALAFNPVTEHSRWVSDEIAAVPSEATYDRGMDELNATNPGQLPNPVRSLTPAPEPRTTTSRDVQRRSNITRIRSILDSLETRCAVADVTTHRNTSRKVPA